MRIEQEDGAQEQLSQPPSCPDELKSALDDGLVTWVALLLLHFWHRSRDIFSQSEKVGMSDKVGMLNWSVEQWGKNCQDSASTSSNASVAEAETGLRQNVPFKNGVEAETNLIGIFEILLKFGIGQDNGGFKETIDSTTLISRLICVFRFWWKSFRVC